MTTAGKVHRAAESGAFPLKYRILAFFAQQPDEELTVEMVSVRTGLHRSVVLAAASALQEAGWLCAPSRDHDPGSEGVVIVLRATPEARELFAAPLARKHADAQKPLD